MAKNSKGNSEKVSIDGNVMMALVSKILSAKPININVNVYVDSAVADEEDFDVKDFYLDDNEEGYAIAQLGETDSVYEEMWESLKETIANKMPNGMQKNFVIKMIDSIEADFLGAEEDEDDDDDYAE